MKKRRSFRPAIGVAIFSTYLVATACHEAPSEAIPTCSGYARTEVASPVGAEGVALGNCNGDTILDLIVLALDDAENAGLYILPGTGNGAFSSPTRTTEWSMVPMGFHFLVDVNADAADDVIGMDPTGNRVFVLPSNGDCTFSSPQQHDVFPAFRGLAGHLNGDPFVDLATFDPATTATVGVLMGEADTMFGAPQEFAGGSDEHRIFDVALGDVDGDGHSDLVTALAQLSENAGAIGVLYGTGMPELPFEAVHVYPLPAFDANKLRILQLDDDQQAEVLVLTGHDTFVGDTQFDRSITSFETLPALPEITSHHVDPALDFQGISNLTSLYVESEATSPALLYAWSLNQTPKPSCRLELGRLGSARVAAGVVDGSSDLGYAVGQPDENRVGFFLPQ